MLVFCGITGSKLLCEFVGSDQIRTLDKTRQDVTLAGSGRTIVCCVWGIDSKTAAAAVATAAVWGKSKEQRNKCNTKIVSGKSQKPKAKSTRVEVAE